MPSGSRLALVALLALLTLLALLVVGPAAAQPAATSSIAGPAESPQPAVAGAGQPAVADDELLRTNTTMRVRLTGDGDAQWTVVARYNLTSRAGIDNFRDLGAEFSAGETTGNWLEAFQRAQEGASETTDRAMEIRGVERTWALADQNGTTATGRLELTFTWTNFAAVAQDGQRLVVGDAFRTPTGSWLSLVADQRLILAPPEGYTPVTGGGDLQDQSFYWEGPESFEGGAPSAVFAGGAGPSTLMVGLLIVAGLAVILLFIYLIASRRGTGDQSKDDREPAPGAADASDGGADDAGGETAAAGAGSSAAEAGESGPDDDIDPDLLSDEERVERLLDQNGGRMKQASIVKETGWSNAKVSQLLSTMEEDDRIDKLRIGRENLISFPDEDVADIEE
jgi:hypothetical protein